MLVPGSKIVTIEALPGSRQTEMILAASRRFSASEAAYLETETRAMVRRVSSTVGACRTATSSRMPISSCVARPGMPVDFSRTSNLTGFGSLGLALIRERLVVRISVMHHTHGMD